jgi:hypothetical protein
MGRWSIHDHARSRTFFCKSELNAKPLSEFVGFGEGIPVEKSLHLVCRDQRTRLQRSGSANFFDHVLRSTESYSEKWNYVRDNPVRAGLVSNADEWKYSGEVELLML